VRRAAEPRTTPGGQPWYSVLAILTALTLRAVFRLAYRQAEGLIGSIIGLLGLALRVPDHTTLSRRAATLTNHDVDDASQVEPLLNQVPASVTSFTGDGAYDQEGVSTTLAERHPEAAVIVPPRSTAVLNKTAGTEPTQRDHHLQFIAEHGRMAWQKASGYTKRARAEAAMSRFKQVIGDGLRSRTDQRRATEVDVAVQVLNRMLDLGRPNYVRIV